MQLGDLSNSALVLLQQPGASYIVYEGNAAPVVTGPTWTSLQQPQFSQGLVEFAINEGYKVLAGDIADIKLALATYVIPSTATTFKYALPGTPGAAIQNYARFSRISKVFYQPFGLPYTYEFRPGSGFISWSNYQLQYTGQGYLQAYSYGTQPRVATIDPPRQNLYFFPGSSRAGDTITVEYAPIPTAPSATGVPAVGASILINPTDNPIFPDDCDMAILYYALGFLWVRAREQQAALMYYNPNPATPGLYQSELKKIRQKYITVGDGDVIKMEPDLSPVTIGGIGGLGGGYW